MLVNDCKRNCYLAAALTGLVIGILSMGSVGFLGGLALGLMLAVMIGAILVWGLCNGRGGKAEDAEALRPDLSRTDDAAAGVSPLAQRVEAQLVASGAAVAGYAAGLAGKPEAAPLKTAPDEVIAQPASDPQPVPASHFAPAPQPVAKGDDTIPTHSPRPVEMSANVAPGGMAVVQGNAVAAPAPDRVDAVQAEALEPVAAAKKEKKAKKAKDAKAKPDSTKSKRKKAGKEDKPEKADKNSRVKKLEKALKAVKAERPAKAKGGKTAKASRKVLAAEVEAGPQAEDVAASAAQPKGVKPKSGKALGEVLAAEVKAVPQPDAKGAATPVAPDNLKEIKGVGPALESLLHENGVTRFAQIAAWSEAEIDDFAAKIGRNGGRIRNDDWIGQARTLAQGGETEFSRRVDKGEVY